MCTLLTRFVVVVSIFALSLTVAAAQDMMEEKVVCDADLILSLYNAEYHFDYAAVHSAVMESGMESGFDLTQFDYGQFTPLFDGMMAMMGEDMSTGMMDEGMLSAMTAMMSMSMDDMGMTMMGSMPDDTMLAELTMLSPGTVADEPAACMALRDNLRQFYTALAYENAMMMAEGQ